MSVQTLALEKPAIAEADVTPFIKEESARLAAQEYVHTEIDPTYEVVGGVQYYSALHERENWRFILRCSHGPLDAIYVDALSGTPQLLSNDEIRVIHEKTAIYAARKKGELPLNRDGFVLGEYARRAASQYLDNHLSMHFSATDPTFIPGEFPVWQVVITFRLKGIGPFTLGTLDVNAETGLPISLNPDKLNQIQERTRAIVTYQTSAAAV